MSDAEDQLVTLLAWVKLPSPRREHRFDTLRKWRFDLAWPELMVACEVDGGSWVQGRHTRGAGFERDLEKSNAAQLAGWRVYHVTPTMITDGRAVALLERALR
jgi:hypothetical protein